MDPVKALQTKYPKDRYAIDLIPPTTNVFRVSPIGAGQVLIAKSIPYVVGDPELTKERAEKAWENEAKVLQKLPPWWGLKFVDSFFVEPSDYINVTEEIGGCEKWTAENTQINNTEAIANQIRRQLNWLHSNGILHNDLELKNILLTCGGKKAIIIDFEKSLVGPSEPVSKEKAKAEMELLEKDLPNKVAKWLSIPVRSSSAPAGGRRRRKTRRTRSRRKRTRRVKA